MNATEVIQLLEIPTTTIDDAFRVRQKIESEAPLAELILALQESQDADVRELLCDMLGRLADPQAVPALIEALHDPSEAIRGSAADALGKIRDPRAGQALLEQYFQEKDDDGIRQLIASALGAVQYRPAIPTLVHALSSSNSLMRRLSAWSLKTLQAVEAKDALRQALKNEKDEYTAKEMRLALKAINKTLASQS